ncbi:MAG: hypothetical protein M3388_01255 [Acidobacteriota bacterium]|nr:hypothetical protein [Acidobacteriota bacterium]
MTRRIIKRIVCACGNFSETRLVSNRRFRRVAFYLLGVAEEDLPTLDLKRTVQNNRTFWIPD